MEEERGLETEKELKDAEEAIAPALEGAAGVKDIKQWLWVCRQKLVVLDMFRDLEKPPGGEDGEEEDGEEEEEEEDEDTRFRRMVGEAELYLCAPLSSL